jgi:hypothetical protein
MAVTDHHPFRECLVERFEFQGKSREALTAALMKWFTA